MTDYRCCRVPRSPHAFHCTVGDACAQREMQGKHAPVELPPAPGVVAVVVGWQLLSFQTPPPMNEEREEGGRETDTTGMAKVTGGGKKGEERGRVKRTAERQPVIEARGVEGWGSRVD